MSEKKKINIRSISTMDIQRLFSSKKKTTNLIECGKKKIWSIKYSHHRRTSTKLAHYQKTTKTWRLVRRKSIAKSRSFNFRKFN